MYILHNDIKIKPNRSFFLLHIYDPSQMGDSLNLTKSTHTIVIANLFVTATLCTPLDLCKNVSQWVEQQGHRKTEVCVGTILNYHRKLILCLTNLLENIGTLNLTYFLII